MGWLSLLTGCLRPDFGLGERYKLLKCLGVGGEGEVWLCRDRDAGHGLVAVKLVRRGLSRWQAESVTDEVAALQRLSSCGGHVHIIRASALLLTPSHIAVVTEYRAGGSLAQYTAKQRGGVLSEPEGCYFFRQVLSALSFCHARRIAFRDLKPDNCVLDSGSPPLLALCDFGVAHKWARNSSSEGMCTVAGTPGYLAPQILSLMFARGSSTGAYDGVMADVWAAGALLCTLLTHKLPYGFDDVWMESRSPTAALRRIWEAARNSRAREASPLVKVHGVCISEAAEALIDAMCAPLEADRPSIPQVLTSPWMTDTQLSDNQAAALAGAVARQAEVERQNQRVAEGTCAWGWRHKSVSGLLAQASIAGERAGHHGGAEGRVMRVELDGPEDEAAEVETLDAFQKILDEDGGRSSPNKQRFRRMLMDDEPGRSPERFRAPILESRISEGVKGAEMAPPVPLLRPPPLPWVSSKGPKSPSRSASTVW